MYTCCKGVFETFFFWLIQLFLNCWGLCFFVVCQDSQDLTPNPASNVLAGLIVQLQGVLIRWPEWTSYGLKMNAFFECPNSVGNMKNPYRNGSENRPKPKRIVFQFPTIQLSGGELLVLDSCSGGGNIFCKYISYCYWPWFWSLLLNQERATQQLEHIWSMHFLGVQCGPFCVVSIVACAEDWMSPYCATRCQGAQFGGVEILNPRIFFA